MHNRPLTAAQDLMVRCVQVRDASDRIHRVKGAKGENIPGTWVGACSCGWRGQVRGFKGARKDALWEAHQSAAQREALTEAGLS